jgi:hypothetical protein
MISRVKVLTLAHGVGGSVDTVKDDKSCTCSLTWSGKRCEPFIMFPLIQFIFSLESLLFHEWRSVFSTYQRRRRATWA